MAEGDLGTQTIKPLLVRAFRFAVTLSRSGGGAAGAQLGDGGFQECSGLDIEMDVQELVEGGRNDGVVKRVGRAKFQPLVLKRGMFFAKPGERANAELWTWLQSIVGGETPVTRYDGTVDVLDVGNDDIVARWQFDRGLPARLVGPQLNGRTGEIAIEELHIAHEGLRLEAS